MADLAVRYQIVLWVGWGILSVWYVYEYLGMRLGVATAKQTVQYNRFGFPLREGLDEFGQKHRRRCLIMLMIAYATSPLLYLVVTRSVFR